LPSANSASERHPTRLLRQTRQGGAARMIVTKDGVAFPISRNVVFTIILISVILVASTAAVTYDILSAQGKIGSSGRKRSLTAKCHWFSCCYFENAVFRLFVKIGEKVYFKAQG